MAVKSMTGFGAGSARANGVRVSVELSSVNRKQLDTVLRLPPQFAAFESRLQKIVQQAVSRGRVTGSIQIDAASSEPEIEVDQKRAAATVEALRTSAEKLKLADDLSASMLLEIPGLLKTRTDEQDPDAVFSVVEKAVTAALKKLNAMRRREGKALAEDLRGRLGVLQDILSSVKKLAPTVVSKRRDKLLQGLDAAGIPNAATDERVIKEIALFGEKSDITEELTRLASHLKQFQARLRSAEPTGRELDFLVQELLREINTVASKANDLEITQKTVAFKTELERIREQVQNIE